jgi:hypothetical protein
VRAACSPFAAILLLFVTLGCDKKGTPVQPSASADLPPPEVSQYHPERLFTEITHEFGLPEEVPIYPDGTFMTPEITPSGIAVLDYDNDGLLDVLHVRHPAPMPWEQQIKSTEPNRLFRQEANGRFKEVPGAAGLAGKGYRPGSRS